MFKKRRPKYLKPSEICLDNEDCPNNPDLLLLRDAAADERKAILDYLNAAKANCLSELFLDVAEDEMHHYMEILGHIVRLDPVQKEMFEEVNLDIPPMRKTAAASPKQWNYVKNNVNKLIAEEEAVEDIQLELPPERNMPAICHLTAALIDELHATNKYQRYMNEACDPKVKELFCHLMNEEKEHIAEFTAALFDLTGEPLSHEYED